MAENPEQVGTEQQERDLSDLRRVQGQLTQPDVRNVQEARGLARQLSAAIEKHNNTMEALNKASNSDHYSQFKSPNHLKNLDANADKSEVHSALAKSFAEYLVRYYESKGVPRDALKNIEIKLDDGTTKTISLIRPDGSIENDPTKLIGRAIRDRSGRITGYDFDGSNSKKLDKDDGILTLLTAQNYEVVDTRNSCIRQLFDKFGRYINDFTPTHPGAPVTPNVGTPQQDATPHTSRNRETRPGRNRTDDSQVTTNRSSFGPTEGAVIKPADIPRANAGSAAALFGGARFDLPCPPCPPVLPKIAN